MCRMSARVFSWISLLVAEFAEIQTDATDWRQNEIRCHEFQRHAGLITNAEIEATQYRCQPNAGLHHSKS